jgi:hypothetical protein
MESFFSEARKFALGLGAFNQNIEQLPVSLRAVILGNVGTEIFFRLSHRDAALVSAELEQKEKPIIERRLIDLKVRQAYLKIKGERARLLKTDFVPSVTVSDNEVERIKAASFRHWTRPVAEIEREINERRNLWAANESVNRQKQGNITLLADYAPIKPQGAFEEGQNEW